MIAESGNQTEEDRDMLSTLEEALDGLTRDHVVQVKRWKGDKLLEFYVNLSNARKLDFCSHKTLALYP